MSLDHCPLAKPRDTDMMAALGGAPDPVAAMIRGRDGPARPIQAASLRRRTPPCEHTMTEVPAGAPVELERAGPTARAMPFRGDDLPANDLWDPPVTPAQHMRQQAVAIVLAFVLAALLGQIGL